MRGTAAQEFREFVTARTPALLRYAHRLTGAAEPARAREVVTDALAETRRHWRRARRYGPEEFAWSAIERRVARLGAVPPDVPPGPADRRPRQGPGLPGPEPGIAPPADPVASVLARARGQRRRRLAGAALVAAIAVAAAGVATALDGGDRPRPSPPENTGLLPWPARGDLATDTGAVRAAAAAWRRLPGPGRPSGEVYVLYAGRPTQRPVALLQAQDLAGRPWVAQLGPPGGDGRGWRVDRVQRLTSTSLPAVVIDHGSRESVPEWRRLPGMRQRVPGMRQVQLLVAPTLTGVGVSLLTRPAPAVPGHTWLYRQIRSDGLSGTWQQPQRPGVRGRGTAFVFSRDDSPGTVVIETGMVSAGADLLPAAPPISLGSDPWLAVSGPGEFTRWLAEAYDDGLVARAVLGRDRLTVTPIATPITTPITKPSPGVRRPRAALVYALSAHDTWLVTLVRRYSEPFCASVQELANGDIPRRVAAGRCVPREGPYPGLLLVATLDDVTRVRYTVEAARPGERTYRGQFAPVRAGGGGAAVPFENAPAGETTVVAYDAGGDEYGRWTVPPVRLGSG